MRAIEKEILKKAHLELDRFVEDGIDRSKLVKMVASCAMSNRTKESKNWAHSLRQKRKRLSSISDHLKSAAQEAESCARDPFCLADTWLAVYGGAFWPAPKPLWDDPTVRDAIEGMKMLSRRYKEQVDLMLLLLEKFGNIQTNPEIAFILCYIHLSMEKMERKMKLRHWTALAGLFTCAFEICEKNRKFSDDSLQKIWRNHGKGLIDVFYKHKLP